MAKRRGNRSLEPKDVWILMAVWSPAGEPCSLRFGKPRRRVEITVDEYDAAVKAYRG